MPAIDSTLDRDSDQARARRAHHEALVDDLRERLARVARGGSERSRRRHLDRGKLLPRERVDALLDPGTPFLELSPLAMEDMEDGAAPGAGIITGLGRVNGRTVVVVANDATVKGGTYFPITVKKHLRARGADHFRASTWWTPAARSCPSRTRSSPTGTTSGGSSATRPG